MSGIGVGPYCNEDMSDWWVPISAEPNRMKAAHEVRMCVGDDSVVRYVGVDDAATFDIDHDFPCEPDPDNGWEYPPCTVTARSWHFTAEERIWCSRGDA